MRYNLYHSKLFVILVLSLLTACGSWPASPPPTPTPAPLAQELIFYDWVGDMPQPVLDAFSQEYGVKVTYLTYDYQEEAVANISAGKVYDVVILGNDLIPRMVVEERLAEIDYRHVPNFKNISANFRDLAYDRGNKHSIPYNWGTSGLVIRSDLVKKPLTRWADLWEMPDLGPIVTFPTPRYIVGMALKSLGYSVNSEEPAELAAALKRLLALKNLSFTEEGEASVAPYLVNGQVKVALGSVSDVLQGRQENPAIIYILPQDGPILWGDNFVIPANSPNKYTAELLLNFLLRPEINAQVVAHNYYATPNEAARPLIKPEILNDTAIFPPNEAMKHAEIMLPLTPAGQKLHDNIWAQFVAESQLVGQKSQ